MGIFIFLVYGVVQAGYGWILAGRPRLDFSVKSYFCKVVNIYLDKIVKLHLIYVR